MKTTTLLTTLVLGVLAVSIGHGTVFAQTANQNTCLLLSSNIRYGMSDVYSNGDISRLQSFLVSQGYFNQNNLGTLHFGPLTLRAVLQFQAAHGIPATGFVGPLTRAAISSISCGTTPPPSSAVSLYSIHPSAGSVGTTVSISGFGFTKSNTILMDGSVAARNVPITSSIAIACTTSSSCHGGINQTITFDVPSSLAPNCPIGSMCPMYMRLVTPGTYDVTVMNDNGTSNTLSFTVTGSGSGSKLSVTGLDAPNTLTLGQSGAWTVHVTAPSTNSTLHYSVVWGDEGSALNAQILNPGTYTTSSSVTFTHAYGHSGTYTPVFTISDDRGNTVSVSNSVTITPLY